MINFISSPVKRKASADLIRYDRCKVRRKVCSSSIDDELQDDDEQSNESHVMDTAHQCSAVIFSLVNVSWLFSRSSGYETSSNFSSNKSVKGFGRQYKLCGTNFSQYGGTIDKITGLPASDKSLNNVSSSSSVGFETFGGGKFKS